MNDNFRRDTLTAAADGSRDAAALLLAMLDHDQEAQDAILFNLGHPEIVAVSLAAFILAAVPDRVQLRELAAAWRDAAAATEAEAN